MTALYWLCSAENRCVPILFSSFLADWAESFISSRRWLIADTLLFAGVRVTGAVPGFLFEEKLESCAWGWSTWSPCPLINFCLQSTNKVLYSRAPCVLSFLLLPIVEIDGVLGMAFALWIFNGCDNMTWQGSSQVPIHRFLEFPASLSSWRFIDVSNCWE